MSKRTTIRIPDDVYSLLAKQAKAEDRTISNMVILILKQSLNGAVSGTPPLPIGVSPQQNAE